MKRGRELLELATSKMDVFVRQSNDINIKTKLLREGLKLKRNELKLKRKYLKEVCH